MGELKDRLVSLAYKKSSAFCYTCYKKVEDKNCNICGSDDLMRELEGVGVEYGVDWIISHLIRESVQEVDVENIHDEMMREIYGEEVEVGPFKFDPVDIIKTMDPVSYKMSVSDYIDSLVDDEQLITFDNGGSYCWTSSVELFLDSEGV